jgi:hypothetical protein
LRWRHHADRPSCKEKWVRQQRSLWCLHGHLELFWSSSLLSHSLQFSSLAPLRTQPICACDYKGQRDSAGAEYRRARSSRQRIGSRCRERERPRGPGLKASQTQAMRMGWSMPPCCIHMRGRVIGQDAFSPNVWFSDLNYKQVAVFDCGPGGSCVSLVLDRLTAGLRLKSHSCTS